jgi:hypothetical protein
MIGKVYRDSQELLSQTLIVHLQLPKSSTLLESVINQNQPQVQGNTFVNHLLELRPPLNNDHL